MVSSHPNGELKSRAPGAHLGDLDQLDSDAVAIYPAKCYRTYDLATRLDAEAVSADFADLGCFAVTTGGTNGGCGWSGFCGGRGCR